MAIKDGRFRTERVTNFIYIGSGGWDPDAEIIYKTASKKTYPSSQIPQNAGIVHFKGGIFRPEGETYINFPVGASRQIQEGN